MRHELKTDPDVFQAVWDRKKQYEIRKADRPFAVGDELYLRETFATGAEIAAGRALDYTGRIAYRTIAHILHGPVYGLVDGWVIISFDRNDQQNGGGRQNP
jgi:hypothetical protein